ncbi:hypothetical protein EDD15DRAFT_1737003 [Pisolithus albus]|nr:hypothetical protein EDD15DRAFT_1737003 [Pisolithus albus]
MDPRRTYPLQNHNPSGSPKAPGRVSTNQDVRQRENDGRPRQLFPPPVADDVSNLGYNVPINAAQRVGKPVKSRREQTTQRWNPEAGRGGEPPTPQRERAEDVQGLGNWHHDALRNLPQVTQVQNLDKQKWHSADKMIPVAKERTYARERRESISWGYYVSAQRGPTEVLFILITQECAVQQEARRSYRVCRKNRPIPRHARRLC